MRSILLLAALAAAAPYSGTIHTAQPRSAPDSVVLERTVCYGTCPAYRLSLRRTGEVHFRSRNPGETLDTTDHVAPATLDSLFRRAVQDGFFALPDTVVRSPLCPDVATDHPSLTLAFYGPNPKRVFYYTGCYLRSDHTTAAPLEALARLASAVDSATGARRWIHPSRRRHI
jgi:hypothetical protein